jgi:hypothetical protein
VPKQQTPKQYAGKSARAPRKHKRSLNGFIGWRTDSITKEHLWKENTKASTQAYENVELKKAYFP